jgi:hypothetical protein
MTRTTFLFILFLTAFPRLCFAETLDAVFDDPARAFTKIKRAKAPDALTFGTIKLDSQGKLVKKIYRDGTVTKDTRVATGTFDEKKQAWVAGEAIEGGVNSDLFKEKGKTLRAQVNWDEDTKVIRWILVTKTDEKLEKAAPEFDAILQGRGNTNFGGYFSIAYLRQELDDKGGVIKSFGQTVTSINKDTKVAMGVYNEKQKKWEAGEEIPKGLWNEMFGDFSSKTVHVRIIQNDDRKGIAEILVKKIGDRPGKK